MSTESIVIFSGVVMLVAMVTLGIFKGLIKLLLGVAALGVAALAGWILHVNGYSYLSFVTANPQPWMSLALAITGGIIVFAVLHHGLRWLASILGWSSDRFHWLKGGLTTVLMVGVMIWCATMAVRYRGRIAELHAVKESSLSGKRVDSLPAMSRCNIALDRSQFGPYLIRVDLFEDPERLKLAKFVVWMAAKPESAAGQLRNAVGGKFVGADRAWKLSRDAGIVSLVEKNDLDRVLADPKLTTFLGDADRRKAVGQLDMDAFIGWLPRS